MTKARLNHLIQNVYKLMVYLINLRHDLIRIDIEIIRKKHKLLFYIIHHFTQLFVHFSAI